MSTLKETISQFDAIDEKIRGVIYPHLYALFKDGKLNGGLLPKKYAEDAISIREFWLHGKTNEIRVMVEIHWGGDVYDTEIITMKDIKL